MFFKIKRIFFILLMCSIAKTGLSQQVFHGVLLDSLTSKPIFDAIVYSNATNDGFTSDRNGHFQIHTNKKLSKFTIYTDHIGYESKMISFQNNDTIFLNERVFLLEEIVLDNLSNILNNVSDAFSVSHSSEHAYCEEFFFRESLKENDKYVSFIEAVGVTNVRKSGHKGIYIKGKRQTVNMAEAFVNFTSNIHHVFEKVSAQNVLNSKAISHDKIDEDTRLLKIKSLKNNRFYDLYVNTETNKIEKMISNDLNNQMSFKSNSQKIYYNGKDLRFDVFKQGMNIEASFKTIEGHQYIDKIQYQFKVCLFNRTNNVKVTYFWNKEYFAKNPDTEIRDFNKYTHLTERSNFFQQKIFNKDVNWENERKYIPFEDNILEGMQWVE